MGLEGDQSFTWTIKHFNSYLPNIISSEEFVADGCKWRLVAYPRRNNSDHFSLCLDVASSESLPTGWRRYAAVQLTIVNQLDERLSCTKETHTWFDSKATNWGFTSMLPLEKIHEQDGGFLVNDELKIVAVVDVVEVSGKSDVANESSGEANNSSSDMLVDPSPVVESLDLNSFQLFPSQVEYVRRIFEKHPEIASEFHTQSQHLRSAYMSVLLGLIETLCKPTQELSRDDLADANSALGYLRDTGLNLEWLEDTLKKVTEKKENEEASETRMKVIEEEMKELKLKYSNLEAELEEEKANVAVARAPLSFDDVV